MCRGPFLLSREGARQLVVAIERSYGDENAAIGEMSLEMRELMNRLKTKFNFAYLRIEQLGRGEQSA